MVDFEAEVMIHLTSKEYTEEEEPKILHTDEEDCENCPKRSEVWNDMFDAKLTGTMKHQHGRTAIIYRESELTGMGDSMTTVSFTDRSPGIITMFRRGETRSVLVFEENVRHISTYYLGTVFPLEMCVHGLRVNNTVGEHGGKIELEYHVEIHGIEHQHVLMALDIKVDEATRHTIG